MNLQQFAYLFFTLSLAAVFAGIIAYYFNPGRKQQVEKPKHTMLEEDDH